MLGIFAELIGAAGGGQVADIGCGPRRITTHLDSLGLDVLGIDLSPAMLAQARQAYPGLRFNEGSMLDLDPAEGTLAGVVAWYSIIHTPPERLSAVFAEFHRVIRPGGLLLLAFQVGDATPVQLERAYGHEISAVGYRLPPEMISALLDTAGFAVDSTMIREPGLNEKVQQAYLLATKTMNDQR
jgi:SAM-dependent methyltransferase